MKNLDERNAAAKAIAAFDAEQLAKRMAATKKAAKELDASLSGFVNPDRLKEWAYEQGPKTCKFGRPLPQSKRDTWAKWHCDNLRRNLALAAVLLDFDITSALRPTGETK